MGSLKSKEVPLFDLAPLDTAVKLACKREIGNVMNEYEAGVLTTEFLLSLEMKERVECALVLASELMDFFGQRFTDDPECFKILGVIEAYCRFVKDHWEAASCRAEAATVADSMMARCAELRAFTVDFTG